jgi:hypothetical protein
VGAYTRRLANLVVSHLVLFDDSRNISVLAGAAGVRFLLIRVELEELELGTFIKAAS